MQYVMSSKWSLMPQFEITDGSGAPQFEARGHFGSQITLHDNSGQQVAEIRKHVFNDVHDVFEGGQQVAQVRHAGIFGDKYDVQSAYGIINARGEFAGGNYTLSRSGAPVAQMVRQFSLREKFAVEIAEDENQLFFLCLVLAIEAIHHERNEQAHRDGFGLTGGIGGLIGDIAGSGGGMPGMGGGIPGMGGGIPGMGGNFP